MSLVIDSAPESASASRTFASERVNRTNPSMSERPTQANSTVGSLTSCWVSCAVGSSAALIAQAYISCVPSGMPTRVASEDAISVPSTFATSIVSIESCSQSAASASLASSVSSCVKKRETATALLKRFSSCAVIIGSARLSPASMRANARSISSVRSDFARVSICREKGINAIAMPISSSPASRGTNHLRKNCTIDPTCLSRQPGADVFNALCALSRNWDKNQSALIMWTE